MLNRQCQNQDSYFHPPLKVISEVVNENRLTAREMEVLFYMSRGCSSKETAYYMCISSKTVEKHITNIKLKLGMNIRSHLVRYYFQNIEPSPTFNQ